MTDTTMVTVQALTMAELLAATQLPRERVDVPELGAGKFIWVQGMSGTDRDAFEASLSKGPKGERRNVLNFRARLCALCCINEDGSRMFTATEVEALGRVRSDILTRIVTVGQRLSGISDKDADELGKNSDDPAASVGSSSSSASS